MYLLATMSSPDESLKSISWNEFFYDMLSKGEVGLRGDDCDSRLHGLFSITTFSQSLSLVTLCICRSTN